MMHSVVHSKLESIVLFRKQVGEPFSNSFIRCYQEWSWKYLSLKNSVEQMNLEDEEKLQVDKISVYACAEFFTGSTDSMCGYSRQSKGMTRCYLPVVSAKYLYFLWIGDIFLFDLFLD